MPIPPYPSCGDAGPQRRRPGQMARFGRSRIAVAVLGPLLLLASACSTGSRYRAYCFLIDGVLPRSPQPPAEPGPRLPVGQPPPRTWLPSVHKPYAELQCAKCHDITVTGGAVQRGQDIVIMRPEEGLCAQCHKGLPGEPRFAHAPVLHKACLWCHQAHESPYPSLLRAAPADICFRCHSDEELSTGEHHPRPLADSARSCVDCHTAHGGTSRFFLRPEGEPNPPPGSGPSAQDPGTHRQAAGQPASAPLTAGDPGVKPL